MYCVCCVMDGPLEGEPVQRGDSVQAQDSNSQLGEMLQQASTNIVSSCVFVPLQGI